jgi:hypothetical protein
LKDRPASSPNIHIELKKGRPREGAALESLGEDAWKARCLCIDSAIIAIAKYAIGYAGNAIAIALMPHP